MDGLGRGGHRPLGRRVDVDVVNRVGQDGVRQVEDGNAQAAMAEVCRDDDPGAAAQRQQDSGASTRCRRVTFFDQAHGLHLGDEARDGAAAEAGQSREIGAARHAALRQ